MQRYRVFGGVLAAPFPFPELRLDHGTAPVDWTLQLFASPPPMVSEAAVGRDELAIGIFAALSRTPAGLRLTFDDTGTFDVTDGGRTIAWYPAEGSNRELVRVDILGRVLAVASHERGMLCLHGSAVTVAGSAVAFLAPKGSGKSTLALTLAARGSPLLTDDTLPVHTASRTAYPGVHSVRLWDDAAERFERLGEWRTGLSEKRTVDALPPSLVQYDAVPLAALYELVPVTDRASGKIVSRVALDGVRGAMVLMTHSKLGALMGGPESIRVFDRCAELAEGVPIYRLEVTRRLDAVDEVAATIASWHS